ncbi:unnamed protein product [Pylaiella littoralis]
MWHVFPPICASVFFFSLDGLSQSRHNGFIGRVKGEYMFRSLWAKFDSVAPLDRHGKLGVQSHSTVCVSRRRACMATSRINSGMIGYSRREQTLSKETVSSSALRMKETVNRRQEGCVSYHVILYYTAFYVACSSFAHPVLRSCCSSRSSGAIRSLALALIELGPAWGCASSHDMMISHDTHEAHIIRAHTSYISLAQQLQ